jgi:hypothetical protein
MFSRAPQKRSNHTRTYLKAYKGSVIKRGLLALVLAMPVWWVTAPVRGAFMACFDLSRGHYVVQAGGFRLGVGDALLQQRYGIETHVYAGCIVSLPAMLYAGGYNAVSLTAVHRKFRHDVVRECQHEAFRKFVFERATWQMIRTVAY